MKPGKLKRWYMRKFKHLYWNAHRIEWTNVATLLADNVMASNKFVKDRKAMATEQLKKEIGHG